jgi:predicted peptidase
MGPEVAQRAHDFPFIVIFPQSKGGWHENSQAAVDAISTLHQVEKDYSVDADRVYLTGLSTGGYGTWAIGAKYHTEFAALVPLCAYAPEQNMIPMLATLPIWAFHNGGDPIVLAAGTQSACADINQAGGHAKYTQYGALGHDCWKAAYADPELFSWMLAQRRSVAWATPRGNSKAAAPAPHSGGLQANDAAVVPSPY